MAQNNTKCIIMSELGEVCGHDGAAERERMEAEYQEDLKREKKRRAKERSRKLMLGGVRSKRYTDEEYAEILKAASIRAAEDHAESIRLAKQYAEEDARLAANTVE